MNCQLLSMISTNETSLFVPFSLCVILYCSIVAVEFICLNVILSKCVIVMCNKRLILSFLFSFPHKFVHASPLWKPARLTWTFNTLTHAELPQFAVSYLWGNQTVKSMLVLQHVVCARQSTGRGDAKTQQRGSLHTTVACITARPAPADTWERSTHCIIVVNIL